MTTHEVFNQAPPIGDLNRLDALLRHACAAYAWAHESLAEFGAITGRAELVQCGLDANMNPPRLHTHDRYGNRVDAVEFHPTWHRLLGLGIQYGLHSLPWESAQPGRYAVRASLYYMLCQVEMGVHCPITMTFAAVPTLRKNPELAAEWLPRMLSRQYSEGSLVGMAMTEKQGGSDVRANTTRAVATSDGHYELTGHKWFCSAPMSGAFLVLAQAQGGLSCFLLPRLKPDGTRNGVFLQRLKNKHGNRSNASAEIELERALAW